MALLDQRVSLPQIPRSSALPTAHRRSAAAGWCWRRACDRIDPRPRGGDGKEKPRVVDFSEFLCDGNPLWSHKYHHGNQGGCTQNVQGFVGAELLTGYEDLDSSDAYENRGEGGLKG